MNKHEWHSLEDCFDEITWKESGNRPGKFVVTCYMQPCDVKREQYRLPYPKSGRGAHRATEEIFSNQSLF